MELKLAGNEQVGTIVLTSSNFCYFADGNAFTLSYSTMSANATMSDATATVNNATAPAATGSNVALLSPAGSNSSNTGSSGALANMAQVVLRMVSHHLFFRLRHINSGHIRSHVKIMVC